MVSIRATSSSQRPPAGWEQLHHIPGKPASNAVSQVEGPLAQHSTLQQYMRNMFLIRASTHRAFRRKREGLLTHCAWPPLPNLGS